MPLIITSPRLPRLLLLRLLLQLPYGTRMKRLPPCREMIIPGFRFKYVGGCGAGDFLPYYFCDVHC